ncbi:MAG: hypothetical protein LBO09_00020 [Candidatus Peribacteria bacterium]|jgi:hypothetical protein|nr:hypothetical protein [Candidatus Peribacteria bacterium]
MAVADTSAYGPSNPYNSGTWIKVAKWSDSFTTNVNDAVNNLWGGAGDRYTAN